MHQLTIIGVGPGDGEFLTEEARKCLADTTCVFARDIHAHLVDEAIRRPYENFDDSVMMFQSALRDQDACVLVENDPTFFGVSSYVKQLFKENTLRFISGISQLQLLCARLGESMDDVFFMDLCKEKTRKSAVVDAVDRHESTMMLAGRIFPPSKVCRLLTQCGLGDVLVSIGQKMGTEDQLIIQAQAFELQNQLWEDRCVIHIKNIYPRPAPISPVLRDNQFIRKETPDIMTEVRMLCVCKLNLARESVVWDIGAGIGSVAIQAALLAARGQVIAIDPNKQNINYIRANIKHAQLRHVHAIHARLPDCLTEMPTPTHVMVSNGDHYIQEILNEVASRGAGIRVVVHATRMQTAELASLFLQLPQYTDFDMVQMQINVVSQTSGQMDASHPVFIISATTV